METEVSMAENDKPGSFAQQEFPEQMEDSQLNDVPSSQPDFERAANYPDLYAGSAQNGDEERGKTQVEREQMDLTLDVPEDPDGQEIRAQAHQEGMARDHEEAMADAEQARDQLEQTNEDQPVEMNQEHNEAAQEQDSGVAAEFNETASQKYPDLYADNGSGAHDENNNEIGNDPGNDLDYDNEM